MQQEASPQPPTPPATSPPGAVVSSPLPSSPTPQRHQSQHADHSAAAAVSSGTAAHGAAGAQEYGADAAGHKLIQSMLAYLPEDSDDEQRISASAVTAEGDDVTSGGGKRSQSTPPCSAASCTALASVEQQGRYLVATVAEELKLALPEGHTLRPHHTAAGFTSSASSCLTTAAASSLLVAQGSSSKKAKLFNKLTAACSSTGQPAAVKLPTPPPQTPAEALAAVRSAVAAAAATMGFSIDEEMSKLRVHPPAGAVMERWADVDPAIQPTAWGLLKALNDKTVLASSGQSHRNARMVVNEVAVALEDGPPQFTVEQVTGESAAAVAAGNSGDEGVQKTSAAPLAAAKSTGPAGTATAASSLNSGKAGFAFTATIRITHHKQLLFTATGDGPNHKEAKRAASAAALEQILNTVPGIVLRKYICLLNPTLADMLQKRRQQHQQVEFDDLERSILLLDPDSSVGREQRERLQQEQQKQSKKAEADRAKRERLLAMEQAVQEARDQADSLQTLAAHPLTRAHLSRLLLADNAAASVSGTINPLQLLNTYKVQVGLVVLETISVDKPDVRLPGQFTCKLAAYTASNYKERENAQQQQDLWTEDDQLLGQDNRLLQQQGSVMSCQQQGLSEDEQLLQELCQDEAVMQQQQQQGPAPIACSQMSSLSKQGARHLAAAGLFEQLLEKHEAFRTHASAQEKTAEGCRTAQTGNSSQESAPNHQRPQRGAAAVQQSDRGRADSANHGLYGVHNAAGADLMGTMLANSTPGASAGVPFYLPPCGGTYRPFPGSRPVSRPPPTTAAADASIPPPPPPRMRQQPPRTTTSRPMHHGNAPAAGSWPPPPPAAARAGQSAATAPYSVTAAAAAGVMQRHPPCNHQVATAAAAVQLSTELRMTPWGLVLVSTPSSSSTSSPTAVMQSRPTQAIPITPAAAASHGAAAITPGGGLRRIAAAGQQAPGSSSSITTCNSRGVLQPVQPAACKRESPAAGASTAKRFKPSTQAQIIPSGIVLNPAAAGAPSHGLTSFPQQCFAYAVAGGAHVDVQRSHVMPATTAAAAGLQRQQRFAGTGDATIPDMYTPAAAVATQPVIALAGAACSGRAFAETHQQRSLLLQQQSYSGISTQVGPISASSHGWTAAAAATAVVPGSCVSLHPACQLQQHLGSLASTCTRQQQQQQQQQQQGLQQQLQQQQQGLQQQQQMLQRYAVLSCFTKTCGPQPLVSIGPDQQQQQQQFTPATMQQATGAWGNSCSGGGVDGGATAGGLGAAPQRSLLVALESYGCSWTGFGATPPPYAKMP